MPEIVTVKNLAVTTGSTVNIPVDLASGFLDSMLHGYRLTGSPTLSVANYVLVPKGTAILNQRIIFYWEANVIYGVGTAITIFGKTIPSSWATKNFIATCVYDGSAWQVQLVCGAEEDGYIETADIAAKAVTLDKIEDLARGHILVGSSGARPVAVDFNNSGNIGIGDGTDYNSVAQSGDVIFNTSGASAIQAGVIVNNDINAAAAIAVSKLAAGAATGQILVTSGASVPTWTTMSGDATISSTGVVTISNNGILKTVSVTIPTAQVLTLNATPVTIIPAQGAGTYIEVISATAQMTYLGTAYTTNGIMRLLTTGAVIGQCSWTANGFLFGTATRMVSGAMTTSTLVGDTQLLANAAVVAQVDTGNPAAGTADIVIKVTYRVIS
jgi:hypothetical protein